jgi:hypothetical protein
MKFAHTIFGAIVAAVGIAAFATFYDEFKPGGLNPSPPNEASQTADSLTPANSIAHAFAVLPKFRHITPATPIAQPADVAKSVHTIPLGRDYSTRLPTLPAPSQQAVDTPTPASPPTRLAVHQTDLAKLPSHGEPLDVCARYGGRRVNFMRGHHGMWKCVYRNKRQ